MVFSSPVFLFFFLPVVWLVCRALPAQTARNIWLAAASLVFFSFGQLTLVPLLLGSVTANYAFGLLLLRGTGRRRLTAGLAVTVNLLALGIFKYLDFLISAVNALSGAGLPLFHLTLPVGISFYTFQGLSYVLDVYRDPASGTRSFPKLLLYISFFPQLIAGPIVLYRDVSAQIDRRELSPDLLLTGLERFIRGLGKKLILADTAAVAADAVFAMDPAALDFRLAWLGALCYTLQIYFDFSGYSDMAIGLGRLFGFRFRENFNLPYAAKSIREFWRRWHISLSAWFRDYLYIPLGGNRTGPARTARNKFVVFFLTGLWHGANWTFVLWGLWHGLFSVLEDRNLIPRRLRESPAGHAYAMLVVLLGFVLFRADSIGMAARFFAAMFAGFHTAPANTLLLYSLLDRRTVFLLGCSVLLAAGIPQTLFRRARETGRVPSVWESRLRGAVSAALFAGSVLAMAGASYSPFIYFQF